MAMSAAVENAARVSRKDAVIFGASRHGKVVLEVLRAQGPRLLPDQPFDLSIDTPTYVYERLNLAVERHWAVSIKPGVVHVIENS